MKNIGNPVFSGKKEELKEFVDSILEQLTLEELSYYAYNGMAREGMTTASGLQLPQGEAGGVDAVAGIDTDLPMPVHIGQSWNRQLAKEVGEVIGNELRGKKDSTNPNTLMFTAIADLRSNPLSGRFYEGYSEDPYLTAEMVDNVGNGCTGDDEFYIKAQVGSKHYCVYHSEWDRASRSNYVSVRALMDYHIPAFLKGFKNSHLVGVMTSYGGTNGVPNITFPYINELRKEYAYSLLNISDLDADTDSKRGQGNGFDPVYTVDDRMLASMLIKEKIYAGNCADASVIGQAVKDGIYNLSRKDLEEYVRPQIELWVRSGYFNQADYPYTKLCNDYSPADHNNELSQDVALRAAREGIVLLKNDGILPLSGEKNVLVTGIFSDTRVQTHYSTPTPRELELAGLTPIDAYLEYMKKQNGRVVFAPEISGSRLKIYSETKGGYLTFEDLGEMGSDPVEFTVHDFGMRAVALYNKEKDAFLTNKKKSDKMCLEKRNPEKPPHCLLFEKEKGNFYRIKSGVFLTCFWDRVEEYHKNDIPFYQRYNSSGKYLTYQDEGGVTVQEDAQEGSVFRIDKAMEAGADADKYLGQTDMAVVFVGADSFVQASEMIDRPNFDMGEDQLSLVRRISGFYPGRTVVVVKSDFPLNLAAIQENPNVAAILYESYAGQYDSWALLETLYGGNVPSGRLSATWYKNLSALPVLTKRDGIDAEYTVDMKNASPEETHLTYMYNNPEDVLYPFGYGLSYTQFVYSDISVVNEKNHITVSLTVTNSGNYTGKDVVQVYLTSLDSGYGNAVPGKQLAGFEKTRELKPGNSQRLQICLYGDAYRKWDVSAKKYLIEKGSYCIRVAHSAQDVVYSEEIVLEGESLGCLDMSVPHNVWESLSEAKGVKGAEVSKKRSVYFEGGYYAVESDEKDAEIKILRSKFDNATSLIIRAACLDKGASILVQLAGREYILPVKQTLPQETVLEEHLHHVSTELGYESDKLELAEELTGIYDLTIRFNQPGIRLESIQAK